MKKSYVQRRKKTDETIDEINFQRRNGRTSGRVHLYTTFDPDLIISRIETVANVVTKVERGSNGEYYLDWADKDEYYEQD